ncbi:hypothetical protein SAMN05192561_102267 [Halopenitus malekzadehii]|uniref:Uncharacterized protein n=1 Tax=Halopenitus malekzadehii TaxID=1267564 RepID=A0A1H6IEN4_9EURY|nr:hypothetical protein [Halopenitus malekzadehii]SEH47321.1 hypothetical protein SAMN05192561_102267 [Halopenitus malekzadehii]
MNRKHGIAVGLVVLALALAVGAMAYTGVGPAPGGDSGESIEEFPTEEPSTAESSAEESGSNDGSTTTSAPDTEPFSFTIDETEECGTTCRDVTATLYNEQDETATGITTYIRIFAGENNTDTDDVVWEGTVDVGTLEAGASHTTTERVELSFQGARKVDRNDGWITIQTTVESDDTTVTFRNSEQVA